MKLSQHSAPDMLVYELGNMFTARLGLEELIPLVILKIALMTIQLLANMEGVSLKNKVNSNWGFCIL